MNQKEFWIVKYATQFLTKIKSTLKGQRIIINLQKSERKGFLKNENTQMAMRGMWPRFKWQDNGKVYGQNTKRTWKMKRRDRDGL